MLHSLMKSIKFRVRVKGRMSNVCLNFCQAFQLWKPRFSPWHCIQRLVIQIYIPIKPFVWLCWMENEPIKHPRQTIFGEIILKSWSEHWTSNKLEGNLKWMVRGCFFNIILKSMTWQEGVTSLVIQKARKWWSNVKTLQHNKQH